MGDQVLPSFTPPDFLRIAQQAAAERRQREQDRMQQMAFLQNQQDRILNNSVPLVQSGVADPERLRQVFPDADARTITLWEMLAEKKKADEKQAEEEAQSKGALSALEPLLAASRGDTSAIPPDVLDPIKMGMLAGGDSNPAGTIANFARQQQVQNQLQQQNAAAEFETKLQQTVRTEREKAQIDLSKTLAAERGKGVINAKLAVEKDTDAALGRAWAEGEIGPDQIDAQFGNGPDAQYRKNRVFIEMLHHKADTEDRTDVMSFLRDGGVPVDKIPKFVLSRLAPKTGDRSAFLSPTTGLPLLGKEGSKSQQSVETLEAALHQIDTMEGLSLVIQENRNNPELLKAATDQFLASLNAGLTEGDIAAYYAVRNVVTPGVARATGEVGNLTEVEQKNAKSSLPSLIGLITNPKTSRAQFTAARKFLLNRLRVYYDSVYRNDPELYLSRFRKSIESGIKDSYNSYSKDFGAQPGLIVEEVK